MTSGLVPVYAVAAAGLALALIIAVFLGYAAETTQRRLRFAALVLLFGIQAVVYAAQAFDWAEGEKQQMTVRADTHHVNWWRYSVGAVGGFLTGGFLTLTLTTVGLMAAFGAVLGLATSLFLLFGAFSVGSMTWVWLLVNAAFWIGSLAFYWLYVSASESLNQTQRLVTKAVASAVPALFMLLYLLDKPLFEYMSQFWAAFAFALLNGVVAFVLLVLFYWINSEPEAGDRTLFGFNIRSELTQQQQYAQPHQFVSANQAGYGAATTPAQAEVGGMRVM